MEDERGQQCLVGLSWVDLPSAEAMLSLMHRSERTTRATAQNEQSSRSHAILQIAVVQPAAQAWQDGAEWCKLSLVDLAGSEWAAKAQSDDRSNRLDGAEINKSLLCLKECIRALGAGADHVPFRGSKLTQVLKDSFVGSLSRTVMIANISPASACCEHSINTLRYASRVKEWQAAAAPSAADVPPPPPAPPPRRPPPQATWADSGSEPVTGHVVQVSSGGALPPATATPKALLAVHPLPPNTAPPPERPSSRMEGPDTGRQTPSHPASQHFSQPCPRTDSHPSSRAQSVASGRTGSLPSSRTGSRLPSPARTSEGSNASPVSNVLVVDGGTAPNTTRDQNDAEAARSHREEAADLSRSLRWSEEQLEAERAAKLVLAAEESLLATHAAGLKATPAALAAEQSLVDAASGTGGMDVYVPALRQAMERRRQELHALESSLQLYEQRCAHEESLRRQVRQPVNLPWV